MDQNSYPIYLKVDQNPKYNCLRSRDHKFRRNFQKSYPCVLLVKIILFQTIESTGLDSLEKEPVTLSGNHVISPEQLFVGTIRKGESGVEFKNVYSNRENRSMFDGMADALTKIRLSSPGRDSRTVRHPRKIT